MAASQMGACRSSSSCTGGSVELYIRDRKIAYDAQVTSGIQVRVSQEALTSATCSV